jgi:hypothetical protein
MNSPEVEGISQQHHAVKEAKDAVAVFERVCGFQLVLSDQFVPGLLDFRSLSPFAEGEAVSVSGFTVVLVRAERSLTRSGQLDRIWMEHCKIKVTLSRMGSSPSWWWIVRSSERLQILRLWAFRLQTVPGGQARPKSFPGKGAAVDRVVLFTNLLLLAKHAPFFQIAVQHGAALILRILPASQTARKAERFLEMSLNSGVERKWVGQVHRSIRYGAEDCAGHADRVLRLIALA